MQVAAADDRAIAGGCKLGGSLAEARAVCANLRVVQADAHEDARLLEALADWCDRYTPLVALDPPHGLLLDVSGCAHFFGGEAAMARDVAEALRARGIRSRTAIAGAAGSAHALAWFSTGGASPPGEEGASVRALPVTALELAEPTRIALIRAGLKTVGDVAGRGRGELAARFGKSLVARLDVALGVVDPPVSPRRPAPCFVAERRFAEPILAIDAALACLRALADALSRRLEAAGQGLQGAEAAFFRADGKVERVALETGAPTRDPDLLLRLFRERLGALADPLDPGFGYDLIRLSAFRAAPLAPKARTFDTREEDQAELAELVDRLATREGRRRVLRWRPQDVHRPEAEARLEPAQGFGEAPADPFSWDFEEPPRRPLRMFAHPEPIEVLAEIPDGPPVRFTWRRAVHDVLRAEGPERIALEWWRGGAQPLTRDYFRVEDRLGGRFWIYRDGLFGREAQNPRWYLHGLFA